MYFRCIAPKIHNKTPQNLPKTMLNVYGGTTQEEKMALAPDFNLDDLKNGGMFHLTDYTGDVILLFYGNYL